MLPASKSTSLFRLRKIEDLPKLTVPQLSSVVSKAIQNKHTDRAFWYLLALRVQHLSSILNPQDYCHLMSGIATSDSVLKDTGLRTVMSSLIDSASKKLQLFSPAQVSILAEISASVELYQESLFTGILSVWAAKRSFVDAASVMRLCRAYRKLNVLDEEVLDEVVRYVKNNAFQMSPGDLCEVLDTFAFLSYRSKSLVDCIVVVLTKSLPQQKEPMECQSITAAQAARILLALARMNFHSRKLTHTCVNAIVGAHEDGVLHLGDIARTIEACTIRPDDSVTEMLMPVAAASDYIGRLSPPQVALFGYWAAHTKVPDAFNWKVWRRAFVRKWNSMSPGALVSCIETIASTDDVLEVAPSLKSTIEDALVARQDAFDESHITRIFDRCVDVMTRRSALALCSAVCKLMPQVTMVSIQWESAVIPSKPQCFATICEKFHISGGEIEQLLSAEPSGAAVNSPQPRPGRSSRHPG